MKSPSSSLALSLLLATAVAAQDEGTSLRARARAAQGVESVQTELPGLDRPGADSVPHRGSDPRRERSTRDGRAAPPDSSLPNPDLQVSGGGAALLLWIAALGLLGWFVVRALIGRGRAGDVEVHTPDRARSTAAIVSPATVGFTVEAPLLDEAEALAATGRYAEAVHLLLLRTLGALREAGGLHDRPWWTSRRILAELALPPAQDQALRRLVDSVESCWFAGRGAGPHDWEHSAAAYRALLATGSPAGSDGGASA